MPIDTSFWLGGNAMRFLPWSTHLSVLQHFGDVELGQVMRPSFKRQIPSSSDFCVTPNNLEGKRGRVGKRGINVRFEWRESSSSNGGGRWSAFILAQIWKLHGHLARAPANLQFLKWRDLEWWERENGNPRGARHSKRFSPNLDVERGIVKTAGLCWKQVAIDRSKWGDLENEYVTQQDVPWSSGKQPSHNLTKQFPDVLYTTNDCSVRESCEER